jgi:hypothetical protein
MQALLAQRDRHAAELQELIATLKTDYGLRDKEVVRMVAHLPAMPFA